MADEGFFSSLPWQVLPPCADSTAQNLAETLGLPPLLAEVLVRRGLTTAEAATRFLSPSLKDMHDPFLLKGMKAAALRICQALDAGERIVICGDYDVDGITSSALLDHFLTVAGCTQLEIFIPNRFSHGYGLTAKAVEEVLQRAPQLVITVDNGITSIAEIAQLQDAGIDTIVTDHHLPRAEGVPGGIVVNPRQSDCPYPFKGTSGCGVALKLVTALRKMLRERGWWQAGRPEPNLKDYLDLAAIGTVADVVPLQDENRLFVRFGLEVLNRGVQRPGVAALLAVSRVEGRIDARTIAFKIAPRINAAGRMAEGILAAELLGCTQPSRAEELALRLDKENKRRREKERRMLSEALELVAAAELPEKGGIVVASPEFHEGVIGIIAIRLAERYQLPVVVLAENGNNYKGSARSVAGINVTEAIGQNAHLLEQYGGHAAAGGCLMPKEHLEAFRAGFSEACANQAVSDSAATIELEGQLTPEQITPDLVLHITRLAPFGQDNKEPSFLLQGSSLPHPPEVVGGKHLKWQVTPEVDMLAWNQAGKLTPDPRNDYRVTLGFNEFKGVRKIQLVAAGARPRP